MLRRTSFVAAAVLLLAAVAFAPSAYAGTFVGDEAYTLAEGETSDGNLYAFGDTVLIEGTVNGDLVAAGSKVRIASGGAVNGDVWAAGAEVLVEGTVEGDVRAAGFLVVLADGANVSGEFLGAGYHLGLEPDAAVDDDFTTAGAQTKVEGSIGGNARISGNAVLLAGPIAGDVELNVEPSETGPMMTFWPNMPQPPTMETGLEVADTAQVGGDLDLEYVGDDEPAIASTLVDGEITLDVHAKAEDPAKPERPAALQYGLGVLGRFLSLIVVGGLGLWLAPKLIERVYRAMAAAPLPAAGWGCLTAILVPVALCVLFVASLFLLIVLRNVLDVAPIVYLSGLLGSGLFFGAFLAVWIGMAVAGLWIGRVILRRSGSSMSGNLVPLLLGCLVVALLVEISALSIGTALSGLFAVIGLGAMVLAFQQRATATPPPPTSPFEGMVPAA